MRHPIRWLRAHDRIADGLLAAVVLGLTLAGHLTVHASGAERYHAVTPVTIALCVLATAPIALRRRHPVAVLAVVTAAQAVMVVINAMGAGWTGVLVATYTLGAYAERRRMIWIAGVFVVAIALFGAAGAITGNTSWGAVISLLIVFPSSIVLGDNVALRRRRLADLAERAERAERERELLAERQVQEERTRIARELHDVVAHSVSVMVIQAGAARRQFTANPERAEQALLAIESTGRQAMTEMRRILGVLRQVDDGTELTPAPSIARLDDLVRADPDLPVEVRTDGSFDDVPAGVEVNVYRVVQEALTNVRRHAGPVSRVAVSVVRHDGVVDVEIDDDGRGAAAPLGASAEGGHGLIGMRERVTTSGGAFSAGPRPGGGWRVRAAFPLDGGPAEPARRPLPTGTGARP